ncbi:PHB depolymerase family esterase [Amaricoccus sp.]|uniref:extracellular catalytic domain type 1 short-chain-length polyhydroxyalkanoate depolymerase n=1 Tax=Amaricoccus sp. TaxID=1872485 RepID=UPI001B7ACEC4|nr:PHB depolymerase family esterase [Amaricoccus sp.]MBP7003156.1 PHB depolymerase family esterase [Amaricoccus sp.]
MSSSDFTSGMAEATRMTRNGRLAEATAVIQRLLSPRGAPPAAEAAAPPTTRVVPALAAPPAPAEPRPARAKRPGLRETLRRLSERARAAEARRSSAPPAVAEGARFEASSFANAAGSRDYKLYVPTTAEGRGPRPLVLMLHGCTQNPDDFARGTRMNAAAEETGALVLYPAQPATANPKRCWNWFRPEDQNGALGEAALLAGLTRSVIAAENVDPARVYVAGISAGGAMAANLAAAYPEIFAAAGVHSGLPAGAAHDVPSAFGAMRGGSRGAPAERPVRTIVFHGDGDPVVNPANAAAVVEQATAPAGTLRVETLDGTAGGRTFRRSIHSDGYGRTLCEQWTVHGAGHAWSGGDPSGSHAAAAGPNASREMLRFFLEG